MVWSSRRFEQVNLMARRPPHWTDASDRAGSSRRGVGSRSDAIHSRWLKEAIKMNVEETMKLIISSLLVLGLLAVQVSAANAVVCARGVYHAGCAGAVGVHRPVAAAAVVGRPVARAAVVRPAYGVHRGVRVYRW
jgi:hypothetical protein